MVQLSGLVERITFYNQENGYTVLRLTPDQPESQKTIGLDLEGFLTVVGNLPDLSPGEKIQLKGDYFTHPKHGLQFKASECEKLLPVTLIGMERYLGSGLIKGIGPGLAKQIVRYFKGKTLDVIENDPNQLINVPGIGPDRKKKIITAWEEQRHVKEIMLFLHGHNISSNLALKIYKTYGEASLEVVKANPYQLEKDIFGVGFKTSDRIARDLGLAADHPSRIEAGIVFVLNQMINEGHVFVPEYELTEKAEKLLEIDSNLIVTGIQRLKAQDRIRIELPQSSPNDSKREVLSFDVLDPVNEGSFVYLTPFYHAERGVAQQLQALLLNSAKPRQAHLTFEGDSLSSEQQHAIETSLINPVSVITGGPGTGKTTCLNALIPIFEKNHMRYALASPTGRAAKRLSEATSRPASTIHRLLGYAHGNGFQYNEKKPLNIDFLIVDEASMLDLLLTYSLLRALKPDTQLLLVGDVDQLPSVGAGDVLRDIIASGKVPVSQLQKIFRQAEGSMIIENAHHINRGQMPAFSTSSSGDFFLFPAQDAEAAGNWVGELASSRIPKNFGLDPIKNIQVLTPMYRGAAGVEALNNTLQEKLNPANISKHEQKLFGRIYRIGDKVMQIRNNYDKEVFNGDIGIIKTINRIEQTIVVAFDQTQKVQYDFSEADDLVLAYAISIHKSQGSEYPAVVIPILTQHYIMLQRNLLYTAVTRAKKLCVLIGNNKAIRIAVGNDQVSHRYSYLAQRINENLIQ